MSGRTPEQAKLEAERIRRAAFYQQVKNRVADALFAEMPKMLQKLTEPNERRCKHCCVVIVGDHENICRMRDDAHDAEPVTDGRYR